MMIQNSFLKEKVMPMFKRVAHHGDGVSYYRQCVQLLDAILGAKCNSSHSRLIIIIKGLKQKRECTAVPYLDVNGNVFESDQLSLDVCYPAPCLHLPKSLEREQKNVDFECDLTYRMPETFVTYIMHWLKRVFLFLVNHFLLVSALIFCRQNIFVSFLNISECTPYYTKLCRYYFLRSSFKDLILNIGEFTQNTSWCKMISYWIKPTSLFVTPIEQ